MRARESPGSEVRPFRRRSSPPPDATDAAIAEFWRWWDDEGRAGADATLAGRASVDDYGRVLTDQLRRVGDLGWQLAPGYESAHLLLVSGQGVPGERAAARRLVLAAPPPDPFWSYADLQPAHPDPETAVLGAGTEGVSDEIDLARVQVSARVDGAAFDLQVHHPAFAGLPADERAAVATRVLHAALGELDVVMWVGEVQPVETPPLDGFGLTALRSVVTDLKRQHVDAEGQPRWVLMRGRTRKGELRALVRSPLNPWIAPHLDTYVAVTLGYPPADGGLPDEETEQALQHWQDELEQTLGRRGRVVGHVSHAGTRTVHVYVDSAAGLVSTIEAGARDWGHGKAPVHEMHDPDWQAVAHLRQ